MVYYSLVCASLEKLPWKFHNLIHVQSWQTFQKYFRVKPFFVCLKMPTDLENYTLFAAFWVKPKTTRLAFAVSPLSTQL